jgi:hypothetical protein
MSDTSFWSWLPNGREMISVVRGNCWPASVSAAGSSESLQALCTCEPRRRTPEQVNLARWCSGFGCQAGRSALIITTVKNRIRLDFGPGWSASSIVQVGTSCPPMCRVGERALMQHVNRLPEEERLVDPGKRCDGVQRVGSVSKLTEMEPSTVRKHQADVSYQSRAMTAHRTKDGCNCAYDCRFGDRRHHVLTCGVPARLEGLVGRGDREDRAS